jgi:hypothetical protein
MPKKKGDKFNLRFEAPVGERLHRYFWAVTLTEPTEDDLWWNETLRKWEPLHLNPTHYHSTHALCKTLRAFKRMLRKYPQIVGKCCLVSNYQKFNVYSEEEL